MNANNAKDYLPLVQALADGKVIQWLDRIRGWTDSIELSDSWPASDYRIKPEPKEIWLNVYPNDVSCGMYASRDEAYRRRADDTAIQVRYREVIE